MHVKFKGEPKDLSKLKKLVTPDERKSSRTMDGPVVQQSAKIRKIDLNPTIIIADKMDEDEDGDTRSIWLSDPISHIELSQKDRSAPIMGDCLNINLAQNSACNNVLCNCIINSSFLESATSGLPSSWHS